MGAFLDGLFGGLWGVVKAVLILLLAFIVAAVAKALVGKAITKTKLSSLFGKLDAAGGVNAAAFIGKLVQLLVFLLFVPGIFESLGMYDVSSPILGLLDTLWGYLPNLLAAGLVLWIGFFIARLVRELLIPVFNKLKINRLQEKAGITVEDSGKLSNTLAYIVYVLILIPIIITALQVLHIEAISTPAIHMLDMIFQYIPAIISALVIIVIGCMVARLCGNIVANLIASSGLDAKLAQNLDKSGSRFVLSKAAGTVVNVVLVVFFVVESFGVLHLTVLSDIGGAVIGYLPYVLAAVLILAACYLANAAVQKALLKSGHKAAALGCKIAIYGLGIFMVLSELGIAAELVNAAFILIVAAAAVAFAVSFGIGGRDFAGRTLKKLEDQFDGGENKE